MYPLARTAFTLKMHPLLINNMSFEVKHCKIETVVLSREGPIDRSTERTIHMERRGWQCCGRALKAAGE